MITHWTIATHAFVVSHTRKKIPTRSKQTDIKGRGATGFNSEMKIPENWSELPLELLVMILKHLEVERGDEGKKSILNCRLVHPQWQRVIDDILEKRCLDFWKKDTPTHRSYAVNHYSFPSLMFNPEEKNFLKKIIVPEFLQGEMLETCPFPTKSACLILTTSHDGRKMLNPTRADHFLSRYGHHLTSLTIWNPNGINYLPADTLQKLLLFTPNLKALMLHELNIQLLKKDWHKFPLPPLPHLAYIRITHGAQQFWMSHNWVLKSYQKQLISIRSRLQLKFDNSPVSFPLLTQLQLYHVTAIDMLSSVEFPSLRILALGKIYDCNDDENNNLQQTLKFLARLKDTLFELYLDVNIKKRNSKNPIKYGQRRERDILDRLVWVRAGNPELNHTFPFLKTFSIFFPKFDGEVGIVKDFLQMFPNLEVLMLTEFGKQRMIPTDKHRATVRKHLNKERYQDVCPKLRKIQVRMKEVGNSSPFLTVYFTPSN